MTTAAAHVVAEAAKLGVDLSQIRGSGAGGRVSLNDIRNAATARPARAQVRIARPAPVRVRMPSPWGGGGATVEVDLFAENPVVDYIRATSGPGAGPEPGFFAGGNTPPFLASGLPVEILRNVPYVFRHAVAAAPTTAEAYSLAEVELAEAVLEAEGVLRVAGDELRDKYGARGWDAYLSRCWEWATAQPMPEAMTDAELSEFFGESEES